MGRGRKAGVEGVLRQLTIMAAPIDHCRVFLS
jgi:hypothetical protein